MTNYINDFNVNYLQISILKNHNFPQQFIFYQENLATLLCSHSVFPKHTAELFSVQSRRIWLLWRGIENITRNYVRWKDRHYASLHGNNNDKKFGEKPQEINGDNTYGGERKCGELNFSPHKPLLAVTFGDSDKLIIRAIVSQPRGTFKALWKSGLGANFLPLFPWCV